MAKKRNPKNDNKNVDLDPNRQPPGEVLTTNQGLPLVDDQNSLKAGVRGPTLLEDFHFREKIQHFDHERIPERVVHARGVGAHGFFESNGDHSDLTKAGLFAAPGKQTPIFVRFSTVAGSRGSADTPRDVRGFAVKFYTEDGVWDLVGNNIPVFFIQDAIKFPDLIHAVKPEPHTEIPQAASAHDTFYDFISLTTEAAHMMLWVMSDRTLPRSLSSMEGFGVHTFRMINAKGKSRFVKFHFKPKKGVHSLVWDESQKLMGKDADFHRRDLYESIDRGDFPEWEMGVQVIEERDEHKFDFDLLDPTKLIPEELVPVRSLGRIVLNRNVENFFAETEQVAFHPGHVVSGIDFSNDPLLQGRLFSYLDTQIKRIGPNFAQLPINRPTCPFHNNQRDGESQHLINQGRVSYFPNSLGGNKPEHAPDAPNAFASYPEKMEGAKVRVRSESFSDHFSQATLFWNSMSSWEKDHIVEAMSFELNMVMTKDIRERYVNDLLVNVATELAQRVAANIGMRNVAKPKVKFHNKTSSPLSMDRPCDNIVGRKIAILAGDGVDGKLVDDLKAQIKAKGALPEVIAKTAGTCKAADGSDVLVDRPASNAASLFYDAVIVPDGSHVADLLLIGKAIHFVSEAFGHGKVVAAIGEGAKLLEAAKVPADEDGVVIAAARKAKSFVQLVADAMLKHRYPLRAIESVPM